MADITFRAAGSLAYASRTTITIPKPAGVAVDDILIASINSETAITSVPTGWALVDTAENGGVLTCSVYYKRAVTADTTATDYSWGQSGGGYAGGGICAYYNCITSGDPVEAELGKDGGAANTTVQWDSITTTSAGAMLVGCCATFNDIAFTASTATSPLTNRERVDVGGTAMYDGLQASAGASGNKTVTVGSTAWASVFIALTPAPSGAVTRSPGSGAVVVAGGTPLRIAASLRYPDAGALQVVGATPLRVAASLRYPDAGLVQVTGAAPTLQRTYVALPGAGAVQVTGAAPSLFRTYLALPDAGTLVFAGAEPAAAITVLLGPDAGALVVAGAAPTLLHERFVNPTAGLLQFASVEPTLEIVQTLQFAYAATDVDDGGWLPSTPAADLFDMINEVTPSDTDYIYSSASPSNDTCILSFTGLSTPTAGTTTLRLRSRRAA